MKTNSWEPLVLIPATFALLFGFAMMAQPQRRSELSVAQAMEARLGLSNACSPLASLPGQTERRWICEQ